MAHKVRGEVEVESGLGLPRLTTVQRLAYTPPADGYVVFDTDLKATCVWDATALLWIIGSSQLNVDDKIDVLSGIGKNSLTLQNTSDVDVIKISSDIINSVNATPEPAFNGVDFVLDRTTAPYQSVAGVAVLDSGRQMRSYNFNSQTVITIMGTTSDCHKSTGKWYWETVTVTSLASNSLPHAGIVDVDTFISSGQLGTIQVDDSFGVEVLTGNLRGSNGGVNNDQGVVQSGNIGATSTVGDRIRHRLDLDNGLYEISANGSDVWVAFTALTPGVTYSPAVGAMRGGIYGLVTYSTDFLYNIPAGYATFPSGGPQTVGVSKQEFLTATATSSIIGGETLELNFNEGATTVALQATHSLTNNPIHGVDGTDPSSLVTKQYADGFFLDSVHEEDFTTAEWVAGTPNTLTVLQTTHSVSGNLTVTVQELTGSIYQNVDIETEINISGDVILKTVGATFSGRVFISS